MQMKMQKELQLLRCGAACSKKNTSWRLDSSHCFYSKHTRERQSEISIQTDHSSGEQYKIVWDDWRSLLKETNIATLHEQNLSIFKNKKLLIKR